MKARSLKAKAACLCTAVQIEAKQINPNYSVCHCESCRQWGGGPFFALRCGTDVEIQGEEHIRYYESSAWARRGFCGECGTHLFFQFHDSGEFNMPVGLFRDLPELTMSMQYFSDQRPEHYCFTQKTKAMTREEIFNLFQDKM